MRSLIPSPLWQMNTAVPTPRRSRRLLPARFICEPGGSCKGKKRGIFNNVSAEPPQSKNGLNFRGLVHADSFFSRCLYLRYAARTTVTPPAAPHIKQRPLVSEREPTVVVTILCSDVYILRSFKGTMSVLFHVFCTVCFFLPNHR